MNPRDPASTRSDTSRPHIERAVRFIGEHLDSPLPLKDVARVAHLSEFHFHRIFSAVMGEPVGQFITRRRLETGALLLAYQPQLQVTDIAMRCGYSSVSNFSKAFSAWFGCSPRQARSPGAPLPPRISRLTRATGRHFDPSALFALPREAAPAVTAATLSALESTLRIEERDALDVVCLASPAGYDFPAIEKTWMKLLRHARVLGLPEGPIDTWGMAFDSPTLTAPELCRYHACVPGLARATLPAPLFRSVIPGGRWAVFPYVGPVSGVEAHYRNIYSVCVPQSGLTLDDFVAVEHYVNDAPVAGEVAYDILLKLDPGR